MTRRLLDTSLLALVLLAIAACTAGERISLTPEPAGRDVASMGGASDDAAEASTGVRSYPEAEETVFVRAPWEFEGEPGYVFATPNYRIYTTGSKPWMHEYAAQFTEQALEHYRTSLATLPPPEEPLEIFLFADRRQWQAKTREVMKDQARLYLNLGRGGYATHGTAVLYDIGFNDTFAIMSHEGWHQFTQVVFRNALPTWLEEGLAAYMEGRRQIPGKPVEFDPWLNHQRLNALTDAVVGRKGRRLIPLGELVDRSPQHFLKQDDRQLLTYYAQVWALAHFLVSGEDGRYRESLARLLEDAAKGRIVQTILTSPNILHRENRRDWAGSTNGAGVIYAYFTDDYEGFAEAYERFVRRIVKTPSYRPGDRVESASFNAVSPTDSAD